MTPKRPLTNSACQPQKQDDLMQERAIFMQNIRSFFQQKGFLEVETPTLIPCADPSPHLDSFRTQFREFSLENDIDVEQNNTSRNLFLRTSPEFAMKQLVAAGYDKIFQIGKFFRNGEISPMHNPEFTGLEWYASHHDYHYLMDMTEEMCRALWPKEQLVYQEETIDLSAPWERITVHDAIARYAQISLSPTANREEIASACESLGLTVQEDDVWDDLFFKIFITYVEPHLGKGHPMFLFDYPIQLAALSRPKPHAPHIAERVELYIAGLELANGYSELTDPVEQEKRWKEEEEYRKKRGETSNYPIDEGLLNALQSGMPPSTGIAVGLDRLLMLQRDAATIQEILPFPISPTD